MIHNSEHLQHWTLTQQLPSIMLVLSAIEMLFRITHIQQRGHIIPVLARTTWQPEEVQEEGELLCF
jgi:hypothetical protein